jgi:hypothetical protein
MSASEAITFLRQKHGKLSDYIATIEGTLEDTLTQI